MQIILISSRTLGASELLPLLSLFSHLFFLCVVYFLALIVVVFEVFTPLYISSSSSFAAIRLSSLLPSGLVVGYVSSFIAA